MNNDVDFDNNGVGVFFIDIMLGIVILIVDGEFLNDGDFFNCYFNYDVSGNNIIDFGFFNFNVMVVLEVNLYWVKLFFNLVIYELRFEGNLG